MNEPGDYSPHDSTPISDHLTVPDDCAGLRLDQALARLFPSHSRSRLQSWLKAGLVTLDGGTRDAKQKVWGGEALQVCPPMAASETASLPEDIPLEIVFEDECMLVINKPADLVVHPGSGNWSGTLLNALLYHAPELAGVPRAGIVHRLDKDTTGLMVVARTLEAQTDLVRQLQARSVKRHYIAVAHGLIAADGKVDAPIGRHPVHRTRMAVVPSGRPALTHYHVRERFVDASLVECRLETGRTHQIRVHLASIGHPLAGDTTYGLRRCNNALLAGFLRQALHAFRLGLVHPVTRVECAWEAPLPVDLLDLIEQLRSQGHTA